MNVEHYTARPQIQRRVQLIESDFSEIRSSLVRGSVLDRDPDGTWTVPRLTSGTFTANDGDWIQLVPPGYANPDRDWSTFQFVSGPVVEYVIN